MFEISTEPVWSSYIAGGGIGLLTSLVFLLSNRPLGRPSTVAGSLRLVIDPFMSPFLHNL
jgi:hypothetical protein